MIESSKYFQAMLGPNFREGNEKEIVLHGIDGFTLQHLIDFSYAGGTTITTDNFEALLDAAASMEFVELEQDCCKFLMDNLSLGNFPDALFFADKYSFEKLKQKALNLIRDHFEDIPVVDLLEISYESFVELLKYEHSKIEESVLFDRLAQWVGHNKTERAKHVPSLVKHIRMQHITDEVIQIEKNYDDDVKIKNVFFSFSNDFKFFFEKVKPFFDEYDCKQISAGELKRLLQPHTPTRLCRFKANELYFSVPSSTGIEFLKFDPNSKRWEQHKRIKIRRNRDFGSVFIGDKLYIIGGISNGSPLSKVSDTRCLQLTVIHFHGILASGDIARFGHRQSSGATKFTRSTFTFRADRHWKVHLRFRGNGWHVHRQMYSVHENTLLLTVNRIHCH